MTFVIFFFFWAFWPLSSLEGQRPDVTEATTAHFTSGSKGVVICWVKAFLESRGQGVIGPSAWIWNSSVPGVDSHSTQILSELQLNTLSIFGLALGVSKTGESRCARGCLLWLLMSGFVLLINDKRPVSQLLLFLNYEGFFFTDFAFFFSVRFHAVLAQTMQLSLPDLQP